MTGVKICGIMTPAHACTAVEAGADFLGLNFAPSSRRRISVEQACAIVAEARQAAARRTTPLEIVGVFVNETPAVVNAVAAEVGLDRVQLSGHEAPSVLSALHLPIVKAIRFDDHTDDGNWIRLLDRAQGRLSLLVDAHVPGSFGGAGVTADWRRTAELAHHHPLWLAGGLTPDNVAAAIRMVRPQVVDVSSGVETGGVKDAVKIQAFIERAKS